MLYRRLAPRNRPLALFGSLLFGFGPLCAVSMLFLTTEINDLHVYLAFAAYLFMTGGLLVLITLESWQQARAGGLRGLARGFICLVGAACTSFLVLMLTGPTR